MPEDRDILSTVFKDKTLIKVRVILKDAKA